MIINEYMKCQECGSARVVTLIKNGIKVKVVVHETNCSNYEVIPKGIKTSFITEGIIKNRKSD